MASARALRLPLLLLCSCAGPRGGRAQLAGTASIEAPPAVLVARCSKHGGCEMEHANATLDANWRWIHSVRCSGEGSERQCFSGGNCYSGTGWDEQLCPDPKTCAERCALEGVTAQEYDSTYGVRSIPGGVELAFVSGSNVGSRLYLTDTERSYKMFRLKNREFSFDVDVSSLPCGLNGAVYFSEMEVDGGIGGGNNAGARFGTGYCDAQCPHDVKFINGEANIVDWDSEHALGRRGACCTEMDLWEANSQATAFTAHPCSTKGTHICDGRGCGGLPGDRASRYDGVCDKDGCDFNSFRMGNKTFFGKGPKFAVDTSKPITVVTQWITEDGTDSGDLSEIRRVYVQDGQVIRNSHAEILPDRDQVDTSLSEGFCRAQKRAFGDRDDFQRKGGLKRIGEALDRGMVLVVSLWDDALTRMSWLDASMGEGGASQPGVLRGPCSADSGRPEDVRAKYASASVKYTNFMYGELDSTYTAAARASRPSSSKLAATPPPPPSAARPSPSAPSSQDRSPQQTAAKEVALGKDGKARAFQQCGGKQWTGPSACEPGCRCVSHGEFYSQCAPPAGGAWTCDMRSSGSSSARAAAAERASGHRQEPHDVIVAASARGISPQAVPVPGRASVAAAACGAAALAAVAAALISVLRRPRCVVRRGGPPPAGLLVRGDEECFSLLPVGQHETA